MKGMKHGIIPCELKKLPEALSEIDKQEWEVVTVIPRHGGIFGATEEALIIVRIPSN